MVGPLLRQLVRALCQYVVVGVMRLSPGAGAKQPPARDAAGLPQVGSALDAPPLFTPRAAFDWRRLSELDKHFYSGGPHPAVLDFLIYKPTFVLDVGCSSGNFAAQVKQRFPESRVWGIEPNKPAAEIAGTRIDRVLSKPIENIDWEEEGVQRGEIDTVLLFDVLEHMYDPWAALVKLRNLIAPTAQLLVSIPNVRNILLIQDLASGYWRHQMAGLRDITHIRFFTQKDMYRMFYQTGYRVVKSGTTECCTAADIFAKYQKGPFPQRVDVESASITVDSLEDLASLCALQFQFALRPAEYDRLSPDERQWVDAPHPPTSAYAGGPLIVHGPASGHV